MGNTKACAYKKRAVLVPDNLEGPAYALDIGGQSMFGEQIEDQNKFSFKGYFEKLTLHELAIDAIVTRLTFDDKASVPKLHFTPMRVLTKEEYALILQRADDPEVAKMLKDLTNDMDVNAEMAAPAPIVPKAAPPVVPVVQTPVTPKTKGFVVEASPAVATPAAPTNGGGKTMTIDVSNLVKFDD